MRSIGFKLAIAFTVTLIAAAPAPAFYWTLKSVPSLVNPVPPIPGGDPIPLPPDKPTPGGGGGTVPEPASAAAGAIGLVVIGARRLLRRRSS